MASRRIQWKENGYLQLALPITTYTIATGFASTKFIRLNSLHNGIIDILNFFFFLLPI